MHIFIVLGLLMAMFGFGSAVSGFLAKEESNQKIGIGFAGLFLAAAAACWLLNFMGAGR